jgi:hypothetical protein
LKCPTGLLGTGNYFHGETRCFLNRTGQVARVFCIAGGARGDQADVGRLLLVRNAEKFFNGFDSSLDRLRL